MSSTLKPEMRDMIFEFRSYQLQPGVAPRYLQLLQSRGLTVVCRHLPLLGFWMTESGRLNMLHHLWAYEDLDERSACRVRLMADKEWTEGFIPVGFPLIERQTNRLMRLLHGSPAMEAAVNRRRSPIEPIAADNPVLAEALHCLMIGDEFADEQGQIARFVTISGEEPGSRLAIAEHAAALPNVPPAAGVRLHELMRPATFSPLR